MRASILILLTFILSTSCFSQVKEGGTITVKKTYYPVKAVLDTAKFRILVYDAEGAKLDSSVISFDMIFQVPSGMSYVMPNGQMVDCTKPYPLRSHTSYMNSEMRKQLAITPKNAKIYFQNIMAKGPKGKPVQLKDILFVKP